MNCFHYHSRVLCPFVLVTGSQELVQVLLFLHFHQQRILDHQILKYYLIKIQYLILKHIVT